MELQLKNYNVNLAYGVLKKANAFLDEYKVISEFVLIHCEEYDVGEIWAISFLPETDADWVRQIGKTILERFE